MCLQKESPIYSDAKSLEEFLDMLLEKWVPSLAYDDSPDNPGDDDCSAPKRLRRTLPEWPAPLTPVLQGAHDLPTTSDLLQLWNMSGSGDLYIFCFFSITLPSM